MNFWNYFLSIFAVLALSKLRYMNLVLSLILSPSLNILLAFPLIRCDHVEQIGLISGPVYKIIKISRKTQFLSEFNLRFNWFIFIPVSKIQDLLKFLFYSLLLRELRRFGCYS